MESESWYRERVLVDYGNTSYQRSKFNDPHFDNVPDEIWQLWYNNGDKVSVIQARDGNGDWERLYKEFSKHGDFDGWFDYLENKKD